MADIIRISWADVRAEAERIAATWRGRAQGVYGVPQGGVPLAVMVADMIDAPLVDEPTSGAGILVVDDLVDTGATMARYNGYFRDAAFRKPYTPSGMAEGARVLDGWLAFPWERDDGAPTDAVVRLLQHIGEDPTRDGLLKTPSRVVKAWREMTSGYDLEPADVLSTTFEMEHDEMIVLTGVEYWSTCEHHLLPFYGKAAVAYIPQPGSRIVGLSKLARLVDAYAKRLQVQERLTNQIAKALDDHLAPRGVGVVLTGTHTCMAARGVRKQGTMVTSCLMGDMRTDAAMRAEFLRLAEREH